MIKLRDYEVADIAASSAVDDAVAEIIKSVTEQLALRSDVVVRRGADTVALVVWDEDDTQAVLWPGDDTSTEEAAWEWACEIIKSGRFPVSNSSPHIHQADEDLAEVAARAGHDAYNAAAVAEGWKINPACDVPFDALPEANKAAMRAAYLAAVQAVRVAILTADGRGEGEK